MQKNNRKFISLIPVLFILFLSSCTKGDLPKLTEFHEPHPDWRQWFLKERDKDGTIDYSNKKHPNGLWCFTIQTVNENIAYCDKTDYKDPNSKVY